MSIERAAVDKSNASDAERHELFALHQAGNNDPPPLVGLAATIAALYFGRDIFMPLATAVLLTFALAPVVSGLRKLHVPRAVAVITVVVAAFAAIILFGMVVASQLGSLAENLRCISGTLKRRCSPSRTQTSARGSMIAFQNSWRSLVAKFKKTNQRRQALKLPLPNRRQPPRFPSRS